MEIRQVLAKDADKYQEIRLEALQTNPEAFASSYEEEEMYSLERFRSRLQDDHSYTFGAYEQDKLVGVVSLVVEQKNKIKHRANIYAMYVKPDSRGNGIAKNLMVEAVKVANRLKGIEQVYLSVVSSNEPAKRLYQSIGFKIYGLDKRAIKIDDDYFDEELMVLYL
jgi:ribosomal protein S18 acetylase RimI-like enzyme